MKTATIPVVIGTLGLAKKGMEKYTKRRMGKCIKKIPGNIKIKEVKKQKQTTLLSAAHILKKIFIK